LKFTVDALPELTGISQIGRSSPQAAHLFDTVLLKVGSRALCYMGWG